MADSKTFHITGMDCADCARTIEDGVAKLTGVSSSRVNFTMEMLHVEGEVPPEQVVERVRELGYNVRDEAESDQPTPSEKPQSFLAFMLARSDTRAALFAALLVLPGLIFEELFPGLGVHHWTIDALSVAAMAIAGWPIARSGWAAVRINRQVTINALMTIAAVGAVIIGAYTEAGVVMVLFVFGEALEGYAAGRARHSIRSLLATAPQEAIRLDAHGDHVHESLVRVEALQVGDVILVKPGDAIPMDGEIVAGTSSVNQSAVTGEARLIEKEIGAAVFAGSINGEGSLEIRVTARAEDNTISRLIRMVEEAHEQRAPTQRFVDRFAAVYTPLVVVLAAGVAVVPPLFFGQPFLDAGSGHGWLYRGLALLVVACPCALVISTPVSLVSAISNAARSGVIFKGGANLETLSRVRAIAFDKTGTLTLGRPTIREIRAVDCQDEAVCEPCDNLLALASALERRSEHPIAHAVVHEARHRGLAATYPAAEDVSALTGRGVSGTIDGRAVTIGSHPYFESHIAHEPHCARIGAADRDGLTTMLVSREDEYLGYLSVADTVRQDARPAMEALRKLGIDELVMLTGDNETTAMEVAGRVGVTRVAANCLPEDKVREVAQMRETSGAVAMIGDGINDTPALATASVGIAIGSSPQAMETADVTLMTEDLSRLPFSIRLSRAAMQTIRFNVIFSIAIKVVFFFLVLAGIGTMWMAVLADMGTSLLVTLNGVRLLNRPSIS